MQIKHKGRGVFVVIDDAGVEDVRFPQGTRAAALAFIAMQNGEEPEAAEPVVVAGPLDTKSLDIRAYERTLKAARRATTDPVLDAVRAVLAEHYDGFVLERIMRRVATVIKTPNRRHKFI